MLAGCGQQQQAPAASDDPNSAGVGHPGAPEVVYIGVLLPQTADPDAAQRSRSAMEIAADIINSSHDIDWDMAKAKGIAAYGNAKLELRFADAGSTAAEAYAAVKHFNDMGIGLVISACDSDTGAAIALACHQFGQTLICGSATGARLTDGSYGIDNTLWRIAATSQMETDMFLEYLQQVSVLQEGTVKNVSVAYINTPESNRTLDTLETALAEASMKEVAVISYDVGDLDMAEEATKLTTNQPDVIFKISQAAELPHFVTSYKQTKYIPKAILCYNGQLMDQSLLMAVNKAGADFWYGSMVCPDPYYRSTEAKDAAAVNASVIYGYLNSLYRPQTNSALNNRSLLDMSSVFVMAQAVAMAGTAERSAVAASLLNNVFPAPYLYSGSIDFDESGQNTVCSSYIAKAVEGRYTYGY